MADSIPTEMCGRESVRQSELIGSGKASSQGATCETAMETAAKRMTDDVVVVCYAGRVHRELT